ncbi:hypothetical protein GCM10023405_38400 [Streptomonospora salina]
MRRCEDHRDFAVVAAVQLVGAVLDEFEDLAIPVSALFDSTLVVHVLANESGVDAIGLQHASGLLAHDVEDVFRVRRSDHEKTGLSSGGGNRENDCPAERGRGEARCFQLLFFGAFPVTARAFGRAHRSGAPVGQAVRKGGHSEHAAARPFADGVTNACAPEDRIPSKRMESGGMRRRAYARVRA